MKKWYIFILAALAIAACTPEQNTNDKDQGGNDSQQGQEQQEQGQGQGQGQAEDAAALCVTLDATDITQTSAVLHGTASIKIAGKRTARGYFYYSNSLKDVDDIKFSWDRYSAGEIPDAGGDFSCSISNFSPATTYYYVASVIIDDKEEMGEVKSFTTLEEEVVLSITGESSNVGERSAKLYGWCNQEGEEGLSVVYGIEYSATDLTTAATTITADEKDSANKYCCQPTDLSSNTLYYYRSFCLFKGVRSYGEVKTFKTADFSVTVTTLDPSVIISNQAVLDGSLSVDSIDELEKSVWFLYSDTASTLEDLKSSGNLLASSLGSEGKFEASIRSVLPNSLPINTEYFYVAATTVHDKTVYGEVRSFTTLPAYYYRFGLVDLGLSVKWSSVNLGASTPCEYGLYFAWGETEPKTKEFYWSTYKWGTQNALTRYCPADKADYWGGTGDPDGKTDFRDYNYVDDAARANLGGKWRTPTSEEWQELFDNCTVTERTYPGTNIKGYQFVSKIPGHAGDSIFLPATGTWIDGNPWSDVGVYLGYWLSSIDTNRPYEALWQFTTPEYPGDYRYAGHTIRPVSD